MKHIEKGGTPPQLKEWKRDFKENKKRVAVFKDFQEDTSIRSIVKNTLLSEQFYVCCYCGARVEFSSSHIEHFKPRSRFPKEQLSYPNLLVSCLARRQHEEELTCGHNKDRYYDEILLISPLEDECEGLFKYTMSGEIVPSAKEGSLEWERAKTTIEKLNLNTYRLTRSRREAIYGALFDDPDEASYLSETELLLRLNDYMTPDDKGKLPQFPAAVEYMIKKEIELTRSETSKVK